MANSLCDTRRLLAEKPLNPAGGESKGASIIKAGFLTTYSWFDLPNV